MVFVRKKGSGGDLSTPLWVKDVRTFLQGSLGQSGPTRSMGVELLLDSAMQFRHQGS